MKTRAVSPYDPGLSRAIHAGVARICSELERAMPLVGEQVLAWMKQLGGTEQPADYYHHPRGSFMFLFPWYLEKTLDPNPDPSFQSDLVYSTINGYYFIRLIDNLTDGHGQVERKLVPALGFFHTQFQMGYQVHFPAGHPFWDFFRHVWFHSADVTTKDLQLLEIDRAEFVHIAAQKTCAVKLPLAALCYHYQRPEQLTPWSQFVDVFGCWHQMCNDLFHWHEDWSLHTATYFLSEAQRRKRSTESIADWVIEGGFEWGLQLLDAWMAELQQLAVSLSTDLVNHLNYRQALLLTEREEFVELLHLAKKLDGLLL